eukprot:GHVH01002068.1.p1 GENE.GHVH01002068.1~~GHVH01002068.1.p1  ORF type:complete len:417 (+),score=30.62 GHVH01002068.1:155-1405(+)
MKYQSVDKTKLHKAKKWRLKFIDIGIACAVAIWSMYFLYHSLILRFARDRGEFDIGMDGLPLFEPDVLASHKNAVTCLLWSNEIGVAFVSSLLLEVFLYYFVHPVVFQWYMRNVNPSLTEDKRYSTSVKATLAVNQLVKSSILVIWGHIVLKDAHFMPTMLGGHGSMGDSLKSSPYISSRYATHEAFYCAVLMRYILDLIYMPTRKRVIPNDFKLMVYHHVVTIQLIVGSWINDYSGPGALVMHLHNLSEPIICLCRLANQVPMFDGILKLDATLWCLMTASWGYLRLIVWPKVFVYELLTEAYSIRFLGKSQVGVHPQADVIANGYSSIIIWSSTCFVILLIMHIKWFMGFMKIATQFIGSGLREDVSCADAAEECTSCDVKSECTSCDASCDVKSECTSCESSCSEDEVDIHAF